MQENELHERSNAKACAPCREAHQACDKGRPCGRCRHLDRTHLCRDPPPPLRKRGRPKKYHYDSSFSRQHPPPSFPSLLSTIPLRHRHSPHSSWSSSASPSTASYSFASASSSSSLPMPHDPTQRFLSSSTSVTRSSPYFSSPLVILEEEEDEGEEYEEDEEEPDEEPLPQLAQYCPRCGVKFVLPEAVFCVGCGLKRVTLPPTSSSTNNYHSPYPSVRDQRPSKKRSCEATTTTPSSPFSKRASNHKSNVYNDDKSERSTTLEDHSTFRSSPTPSCSSATSSSPSYTLASSDSELSLSLPFGSPSSLPSASCRKIRLWLAPVKTRKNCSSSVAHLSAAHPLECFVDNQLKAPWALIRPAALGANESTVVAANSSFLDLSGYSQHELLGGWLGLVFPEELTKVTQSYYYRMLSDLGDVSNCQVASEDTGAITTKDGTWLMTRSQSRFHFGGDGELLVVAVQLRSAIPVRKEAIEWRTQANKESWRIASQACVALPKDVCFHEGSIFTSAPLTSLAPIEELIPLSTIRSPLPVSSDNSASPCSSSSPLSSSSSSSFSSSSSSSSFSFSSSSSSSAATSSSSSSAFAYVSSSSFHRSASPTCLSPLDHSFPLSPRSISTYLELSSPPAVSFRSDSPCGFASSPSPASFVERFSQECIHPEPSSSSLNNNSHSNSSYNNTFVAHFG